MAYEYEKIDYSYDPEYEKIINQIEELREELQLKRIPVQDIIKKDTYDNVAIEGNQMSRIEVIKMLTNDITIRGKNIRDHLQAKNYDNLLDILKQFVIDPDIKITPDVIKTIHHMVTNGELSIHESGQYRNEPISIRFTNYIPPAEWEIKEDIEELCEKLYQTLNGDTMFERICEFKRNFERVHPFIDGNGRTGRLLMNILFLQYGYAYVHFPAEEREKYFLSLDDNTFHKYTAEKMLSSLQNIKDKRINLHYDNDIINNIDEREDI